MLSHFKLSRGLTPAICSFLLLPMIFFGLGPNASAHETRKSSHCEFLLSQFETLYSMLDRDLQQLTYLPKNELTTKALERLMNEGEHLQRDSDEVFSKWDGESHDSTLATQEARNSLSIKVMHWSDDVELWVKRLSVQPFQNFQEHPEWLMPHRIYSVKTSRGDVIRVRFSRDLVEDFFWSERNATRRAAAQRTLEALNYGMVVDGQKCNGIKFMPHFSDHYSVVKIHIVGQAASYRVYGVLEDGIFSLSTFDNSSNHDIRFIQRMAHQAEKRFEHEDWAQPF